MQYRPSMLSALALLVLALGCDQGDGDGGDPRTAARDKVQGQGFAEAMELLCEAEEHSRAAEHPPAERIPVLTRWINREIHNPEVKNLISGLSSAEDPEHIRIRLERAVERAGLEDCALLSFFELT